MHLAGRFWRGALILLALAAVRADSEASNSCTAFDRDETKLTALLSKDSPEFAQALYRYADAIERQGYCDQGFNEQESSALVVQAFAQHPGMRASLLNFMRTSNSFAGFILIHIDNSADLDTLKRVKAWAETSCPSDSQNLCKEIQHESTEALEENTSSPSRSAAPFVKVLLSRTGKPIDSVEDVIVDLDELASMGDAAVPFLRRALWTLDSVKPKEMSASEWRLVEKPKARAEIIQTLDKIGTRRAKLARYVPPLSVAWPYLGFVCFGVFLMVFLRWIRH